MRTIYLIAACGCAVFLASCDQQILKSNWSKYAACIKQGKSDKILTDNSIRSYCVSKYQEQLAIALQIDGRAGPESCEPEPDFLADNLALPRHCSTINGSLNNNSKNYVVTAVEITFTNAQSKKTDTKLLENLWIEPGDSSDFLFSPTTTWENKDYPSINKNFEWTITAIKGLQIDFQNKLDL